MRQFYLPPQVHKFATFAEFVKEFKVGEGDLLFTNQFLYDPYMANLDLKCDVYFQEKYGLTEPTDIMYNAVLGDIPQDKYRRIIAVGGGSVVDMAKIVACKRPENITDFYLGDKFPEKNVELIIIPTTAGTAAEATINYVITDVERKRKFVCVDVNDIPDIAVVDPDMMSTMPKGLTAATGMDALTHAIEGYTTKGARALPDCLNLEAIRLISKSLRGAVNNEPEGREGMALGQFVTGMAFSNVGLGIAHSVAHTLGAVYDTPHGVACAMMLPIVMEYNADCTGEKYKAIAEAMGVDTTGMDTETYRKAAVDAVRKLSTDVGIPEKLSALKEEDIDFLAESAFADACAPGNPKEASLEDIKGLIRKLM